MSRVGRVGCGAAALVAPVVALACPVCGGDAGANAQAYLDTMVFLSLFPLAMIGGIVGLVWSYHR